MPCLSEEFQLSFNAHQVWIGEINCLEALDDLIDVLLNRALRTQLTFVVELWMADVANVLCQVLSYAECESFDILIAPQLFH